MPPLATSSRESPLHLDEIGRDAQVLAASRGEHRAVSLPSPLNSERDQRLAPLRETHRRASVGTPPASKETSIRGEDPPRARSRRAESLHIASASAFRKIAGNSPLS